MRKFLTTIVPALASLFICGAAVFLFVLPQLESAIMQQKRAVLQETVRSVVNLLGTYQHQVEQGDLTLSEAQDRAQARVGRMRYGPDGKDYFWVTDAAATMLMHPYVPRLNGRNLAQYEDSRGKKIFAEMARVARHQDGGWVGYHWQWKDQPGHEVPKLSYVALFEPWGWVVGTGMYLDDVQLEMAGPTGKFFAVGLAAFLLIAAISAYLAWRNLRSERARQKAIDELSESEERFRGISSGALDGIVMLDSQGRVIFWNRAATDIFGYREQEMLHRDLHQILFPTNLLQDAGKGMEAFRTNGTGAAVGRVLELQAIRKNGEVIPVELSVSSLRVRGQWHAIGVVRDISERKKAEGALRASELKHRALFESATDAIFVLRRGRIGDLNPQAEKMFGASRAGLIGKGMSELSPEWQPNGMASALFDSDLAQPLREGEPRCFEWIFEKADGSRFCGEVGLSRLAANDEDSVLAVIRDVSLRKEVEREREAVRALMMATFEQFQDGIMLLGNDGRPGIVNHAAGRILGQERAALEQGLECLDAGVEIYKSSGEKTSASHIVRWIIDADKPASGQVFRLLRADGAEIWIEAAMTPIRDDSNHIIRRLLVFYAITERIRSREERERLQAKLQQAQKLEAIGTLAGGIAHDFNNILTIIMGFAEVALLRGRKSGAFPAEELREIIEGSRRARDLVEQILAYSRGVSLEKAPLDLVPVIEHAGHLISTATGQDVRLVMDLKPRRAVVAANETQIQQIILNLANNAVHAMRERGGTLRISLVEDDSPGGGYVMRVVDTGHGLEEKQLGRVFDPFYTTKAPGEGTGLGLSVVHGLVKEHGGEIEIKSRLGMGTEVRITLPRAEGQPAPVERRPEDVVSGAGKVLLVDDDPDVLKTLTKIIRCLGFSVDGCRDYRESLAKLNQGGDSYDMLITDYDMPGQDGLALVRWAREALRDLPVVMISGSAGPGIPQKAVEAGADAFLQKPISLEAISRTIQTAISRRQGRASVD